MLRQTLFRLILLATVLCSPFASANDAAIRKAVEDHLQIQIKGQPGKASYTVGPIASANLPPCDSLEASTSPGASPWGRSSVTVRCLAGASWTLLVPVRIRVLGNYVVNARPLGAGQVIDAADVIYQSGDLGALPAGVLTDTAQAVGQVSRIALVAGRPLRADMLKEQTVIRQGQTVKVVSRGKGFEVSNEGRALANATVGQVVQVRLGSGQVVSGIADAGGTVEVAF